MVFNIRSRYLFVLIFFILSLSYLLNYFNVVDRQFHGVIDFYTQKEIMIPTISADWRGFLSPMIDRNNDNYLSQAGLHGWIYQIVRILLGWSTSDVLRVTHALLAISFSGALAALLVAVRPATGVVPILFASIALALSPRLVQLSGDTYWLGVMFILPMFFAVLYARAQDRSYSCIALTFLFIISYLKFLSGYEFVTTYILAPAIFMLISTPLNSWISLYNFRRLLLATGVLCVGFFTALGTHSVQIYAYTGVNPLDYISSRVEARSVGEAYQEIIMSDIVPPLRERAATISLPFVGLASTESKILSDIIFTSYPTAGAGVIMMSLTYTMISFGVTDSIYAFTLPFAEGVPFLVFLLASPFLLVISFAAHFFDRRFEPLLRVGFCSILGLFPPLSWYIFGFSHSVIHGFIAVTLLYFPWGILTLLFCAQVVVAIALTIFRLLVGTVQRSLNPRSPDR